MVGERMMDPGTRRPGLQLGSRIVTLGELLNFSHLHFCIYKMVLMIKPPTSGAVVLITGVNIGNLLRTVPSIS